MAKKTADEILAVAVDLQERADKSQELWQENQHVALSYFYGDRPTPPVENRSSHVSQDVYDSIESMKAKLLSMLSADSDIVSFKERSIDDQATAKLANAYVNDQVYRKNNGYLVFHDAIFDALLMRVGCIRVDWCEEERTEEQTAEGVPAEAITMLEEQGWELQEKTPSEVPPEMQQMADLAGMPIPETFDITVTRSVPDNKIKMEVVAPENFYLIEDPADGSTPDFLAERCSMSTGDLLAEYDRADVEKLPFYQFDDLEVARIQYAESTSSIFESEILESRREREVYRAYIRADFDKENEMRWYEVIFGRNVLLEYSEVDAPPFFWWSPIRISHRPVGRSLADVMIPIQAAKTALRRGLLDNVVEGNMPRMLVNETIISDMSEVMDHSMGGIINVSDINRAMQALPPNPLPQGTMLALESLEQEKQARSGYSTISQGMNPDAISSQNAKDTIQMYAKMGQARPAQIARMFAEKLLKPMLRRIFELGVKHENIDVIMGLDPQTASQNPDAWAAADMDLEVAVALTEDEKQGEAMQLLSLHQVLASDPANSHIYPDKNRSAVLGRAAELLNLNKELLIADVQSPDYQQSKQAESDQQQAVMQLQMQSQQAQLQLAQMQLQLQQLMADRDFEIKQKELQLKAHTEQHDQQIDESEVALKQKELMLSMQKTGIETQIELTQQRAAKID